LVQGAAKVSRSLNQARRTQHQAPRRIWLRGALLAVAGFLVYSNSLSGPFVLDDNDSIVSNATLRDWTNIDRVFAQQRNTPLAGRPVVAFTFAVNYAAGGLSVQVYHLTNIAIHTFCALLLFGIVRRTLMLPRLRTVYGDNAETLAFATALIWTVHPLNTEVLNYLTQRTESLMALCLLSTLYAAIRSVTCRKRVFWQLVAVTACTLGMLCKESMVVAPVLIVLYDRVFFFDSLREALRARWRLYGWLALTWIALLYMMVPGPRSTTVGITATARPWNYLLNQAAMVTRYCRLAIWPHGLVVNYGPPMPLHLADVLPQALLVVALIAATLVAFRWSPAAGFLGAWLFIMLAPTSTIIPISTEVGAERRMYLPLMAVAAIVVIPGFPFLKRRTSHAVAMAAVAAVAIALGSATLARNREYASELSLAESVMRHWPSDIAHAIMGNALGKLHRNDEAVTELRLAARTDPRSRYNLGVELYNMKRFDEATRELEAFASENPMLDVVPSARRILGDAFVNLRDWPRAIAEYRLALSMISHDAETKRQLAAAMNNQALALVDAGRLDEAVKMFRSAVEWDPQNWSARHNLAAALLDHHDAAGAEVEARRAIETNPTDAGPHDLLGRALAIQGKFDESIAQFKEGLKLAPGDAGIEEDLRRVLAVRRN
jgi:tetratricopeptide (TPR) repeat protein